MKKVKNDDQKVWWCKGRCYFTILNSLMFIFLCGGQALAAQTCATTVPTSTPTADFVVNGDGTVTHTKTGLMWKVCPEGQIWAAGPPASCSTVNATLLPYSWKMALTQAANATFPAQGYTDWRVPNIKELLSIREYRCQAPAINLTIFPNTLVQFIYWSSSPAASNTSKAWVADSTGGYKWSKSGFFYVRLVRGGQ